MNVLNVCSLIDTVKGGGTGERTFQMSKYLSLRGLQIEVLALDIGATQERLVALAEFGVKGTALPCMNKRYYLPGFVFQIISDAVRRADIIHLVGHWDPINVITYSYAKRLGKPYVVCPAGSTIIFGRSKRIKKLYNLFFGNRILRNADFCIAVTGSEIKQFQSYGVRDGRIVVIPNGIHTEISKRNIKIDSYPETIGLKDNPYILFIGRLDVIKGPDLLLDAFSRIESQYPNHHLVIAGPDNGLLTELQMSTKKRGLENRVHFVGFIRGEVKFSAYRDAELIVIPSRHEAMSIVVLEAGLAGTPALLTDQCGLDEIEIIGGGKVVSATAAALAIGLQEMLVDGVQLKKMGENLRIHILKKYSWETIVSKYIGLYNDIQTKTVNISSKKDTKKA